VRDGKELTRCAAARNSTNYIARLSDIEADNATGDIYIITDNLSSHISAQTRAWPSRASSAPSGLYSHRSEAFSTCKRAGGDCSVAMRLPGQSFANPDEIEQATRVATAQLNRRAKPWIWGRPRHQIIAIIVASFLIAFKEPSTRWLKVSILFTTPSLSSSPKSPEAKSCHFRSGMVYCLHEQSTHCI
jgi:hypothetical protein